MPQADKPQPDPVSTLTRGLFATGRRPRHYNRAGGHTCCFRLVAAVMSSVPGGRKGSQTCMKIRILVTGGTFDKEYDELTGRLFFRDTHLPEMLRLGRCRLDVAIETVMMIDSLELDDSGAWPSSSAPRKRGDRHRHHPRHRYDGRDCPGACGRSAAGQDDCADRRDGAVCVWQLGRIVQSRQRAVVRAGPSPRCLRRDERAALPVERRRKNRATGSFEAV